MEKAIEVWAQCLNYLKDNVSPSAYRTWFEPLQAISLQDSLLTLLVPAPVYYQYIEEHFIKELGNALHEFIGKDAALEYRVPAPAPPTLPEAAPPPPTLKPQKINPLVIPGIRRPAIDNQLNPQYNFENYVEGEYNRIARSAGFAVSRNPGKTSFNPLMIYGAAGAGKTHLLHAIGNNISLTFPEKNILYVSTHVFMQNFVYQMKENTANEFVAFHSGLDVLIIDDLQFLDKKKHMQDMFFTIFNNLQQANKQIIMTSDRAPRDMEGIEERLISRFRWGLLADLGQPDVETRMAVMTSNMERENLSATIDIIEYLCHHINNLREIVGAVNRMAALTRFNNGTITMDTAKDIIKRYASVEVRTEVSVASIIATTAEYFKTTTELLISKSRKQELVAARQMAMFLCKRVIPTQSLAGIGEAFGGRDHTTVIYACKAIENLITTDPKTRDAAQDLERKIRLSVG